MKWFNWTHNERLSMAALGSQDWKNLAAESHERNVAAILAFLECFKSDGCCAVLPNSCAIELVKPIDSGTFTRKLARANGLVAIDTQGRIVPWERGDIPIDIAKNSAAKGELVEVDLTLQKWNAVRR